MTRRARLGAPHSRRYVQPIDPLPSSTLEQTELRDLIGHRVSVPAQTSLEAVHKLFDTHGHEFMAVLEDEEVIGLCSRHEVGMRLGARYGFALFSGKPVRTFLSPRPVFVKIGQPIRSVLETVFSRADESFYDDVLLLSETGSFLGLIYVHTLVRLQTVFLRASISLLETQKLELRSKNEQMEADLAMAREVQLALLPESRLTFPPGAAPGEAAIGFASVYRPAEKVGGDFVHVVPLRARAVGVFIADVMGHGVRSALVTSMLRVLVEEALSPGGDPGALLTRVNANLCGILHHAGNPMFATALYAVADLETGILSIASGGHPPLVRLRRESGEVAALTCPRGVAGPGLCLFADATYGTAQFPIQPNDLLLLYTDGLIEARNGAGELYGDHRLAESLRQHADVSAADLLDLLISDAARFAEGVGFDDDLCLAALDLACAGAPDVAPRSPLAVT